MNAAKRRELVLRQVIQSRTLSALLQVSMKFVLSLYKYVSMGTCISEETANKRQHWDRHYPGNNFLRTNQS